MYKNATIWLNLRYWMQELIIEMFLLCSKKHYIFINQCFDIIGQDKNSAADDHDISDVFMAHRIT